MNISWIAVFAATVAAFAIGALWYSPVLFANAWQREAKVDDASLRDGRQAIVFGGAFVLLLAAAAVFAAFLGPKPSVTLGVGAGFAAGLAWVTAGLGVIYLFERRSLQLVLINGGYLTLAFTAIGLVIALLS
jgi:Protein of unknown function (DUF1761)